MQNKSYVAIDLKSFYASVECVQRGLDPLNSNLVVADTSRTEKTICLAVSPSLKAYGIPGRARLFEVIEKVKKINLDRLQKAPNHRFTGKSCFDNELKSNPSLKLDFFTAIPQMGKYMQISSHIFSIYLRYIAPEDIHIYSIDEVFIDVTNYLTTYKLTAKELALKMIKEVLNETGITATVGIGTNLYLSKIAMDIVAKSMTPDEDGVRIAELDESEYRRQLWDHTPLTDFWRIGNGYQKRLQQNGIFTMGDIARCSIGQKESHFNEDLLYNLFGINAELLIDHAWGIEPCTIADIKSYRPENSSLSRGQVLKCGYTYEKAEIVLYEMADSLSLNLFEKGLVTDQITLTVCYDTENLAEENLKKQYCGEIENDRYGRKVPKDAHGSVNLKLSTSSEKLISDAVHELFDQIVNKKLLVKRIYLGANHIIREKDITEDSYEQINMFTDYTQKGKIDKSENISFEKEKRKQKAVLEIKQKFGKNAILKGLSYKDGATIKERNDQVGGHRK